ncbi:hypothetical protein NUACC21_34810 [Scytonema sp. NUACC21]
MIHQIAFTHPKPGMSEKDFQDYWKKVHAIEYASKVSQIKRYMIASRIPFGPELEDPLWSGVAEIWMENEEEQIASLQSKEFLEGARRDEPKWSAFWRTVVLDTTTHTILKGLPLEKDPRMVKLFILTKRKAGMSLEDFRRQMLERHASNVLKLSGLRRYLQCHVRDSSYAVGETTFDCVSQLWFDDIEALEKVYNSSEYQNEVKPDFAVLFEPKYIHTMVTDETWIIGP